MNDFIIYLLESGISLCLLFAAYWFLLRRDKFFASNRFYLLSAIVLSFMLPWLNFSGPVRHLFPFLFSTDEPVKFTPTGELAAATWGLPDFLIAAYCAGVLFFLMRFLFQGVRLVLLARNAGMQRQNGIDLVIADEVHSPFSFFTFVFLSPRHLSDRNWDRIVAHELIHVKQRHSADLLFVELAVILQWINPVIWLYRRALKETHEFLADEEVIANGFSRAGYQMLIYEQLVGGGLFEFANNFNDSQIKRRLEMMTKAKSRGLGKLKALAGLPLIFLLAVAFGVAGDPGLLPAGDMALLADAGMQQSPGVEKKKQEIEKKAAISAEELLKMRSEIDAKLANQSLSEKDRTMLLDKKKKVEMELTKQKELKRKVVADGYMPPPPSPKVEDLLKMRSDIDAKLANESLSDKDRAMLLDKKKKIETELKKQKEKEKQISENGDPAPPPPKVKVKEKLPPPDSSR